MVGTPGRLLDLAQQGHLQLGGLSVLVLDEADEMLDLGFLPDIERILRQIPADRQSMLFSATMPDPIITLARTFMVQPTHIRAEAPHSAATHDTTEQFVYRAHALDKVEMVSRILQAEGRGATMVFTRTKRTAQKVADELAERGFAVGAVHGDLGQIAREKALKAFRTGEVDVLVATDVAARGIDIDDITHVINYQMPRGRAGLRAPDRPHRPRRQDRHRRHPGGLGRAAALDDDQQGAGPGLPRPGRDVLQLAAPVRRTGHPAEDAGSAVGKARKSPVKRRETPSDAEVGEARSHALRSTRQRTRGGQAATGHPGGNPAATGDGTAPTALPSTPATRPPAGDVPATTPAPSPPAQARRRHRTQSAELALTHGQT